MAESLVRADIVYGASLCLFLTALSQEREEGFVEIADDDLSGDEGINPDEMEELAASIVKEFKEESQLSSLETALYLLRESLDLRPVDHPLHSKASDNLSLALLVKFHWTGDSSAMGEATHLIHSKMSRGTVPQQSIRAQPEIKVVEEKELRVCQCVRSFSKISTYFPSRRIQEREIHCSSKRGRSILND